jgi:hypothetical protein
MESVEDRTMELSGLPLFPQPLEIAKEQRFHTFPPHDCYGQFNFAEIRTFELCSNNESS